MKYEMIFGDEKLFGGAPDDAEYAGWFCQEARWYMILNGKILFSDGGTWCTSDNPYLSSDIAAMRRIIKEPKRWTWEDKKAGVLPEVGYECIYKDNYLVTFLVLYIDGEFICLKNSNGNVFTILVCDFMKSYRPIETPAEKSQRLRDEWCKKVMDLTPCADAHILLITAQENQTKRIYDALLSGELQAPKGE